jgi:hypothetical protein
MFLIVTDGDDAQFRPHTVLSFPLYDSPARAEQQGNLILRRFGKQGEFSFGLGGAA